MFAYAQDLAARKRAEPADDVMTALVEAEVDGRRLTDPELEMFFFLLVIAGNDTVRSALPGGVLALVDTRRPTPRCAPTRSAAARRDRGDAAVAPAGAHVPPHRRPRPRAGRHGRSRPGTRSSSTTCPRNRDERRFTDPDRFDIARARTSTWRSGRARTCAWARTFARLQMRIFLTEFLTRLPEVHLDGAPRRLTSNFINGLTRLPLRW